MTHKGLLFSMMMSVMKTSFKLVIKNEEIRAKTINDFLKNENTNFQSDLCTHGRIFKYILKRSRNWVDK